jgi:hypothetical protein
MNALTSPLTNVLIGSVTPDDDAGRLCASFEAAGGDPSKLELLTQIDDVDRRLLLTEAGGSLPRFSRRLSMALHDPAEHHLDIVRRHLSNGRYVVVLHGVGRGDVATMADRLRSIGADNLHYAGRWTWNDHGLIPPRPLTLAP